MRSAKSALAAILLGVVMVFALSQVANAESYSPYSYGGRPIYLHIGYFGWYRVYFSSTYPYLYYESYRDYLTSRYSPIYPENNYYSVYYSLVSNPPEAGNYDYHYFYSPITIPYDDVALTALQASLSTSVGAPVTATATVTIMKTSILEKTHVLTTTKGIRASSSGLLAILLGGLLLGIMVGVAGHRLKKGRT